MLECLSWTLCSKYYGGNRQTRPRLLLIDGWRYKSTGFLEVPGWVRKAQKSWRDYLNQMVSPAKSVSTSCCQGSSNTVDSQPIHVLDGALFFQLSVEDSRSVASPGMRDSDVKMMHSLFAIAHHRPA